MRNGSLESFFSPKTIAVVGASPNEEKVGGILMKKLSSFKGKIIPVNPHHSYIDGFQCFQSISKVSEKVDLVVIATPKKFVIKIIEECALKCIKNIIIISAGFSEIGDKKTEDKIKQLAGKHHLNILGPNCFGICNPFLDLDTTFANSSAKKGSTAFISQSGALWSYISDLNIGFSGFISLGNMSNLDFNDWIEFFLKDKKTKKIVLYIEKLKNGKKFIKLCKNSRKEIIAVKAGQTSEGIKATISHTASLATDYKIYEGAFSQAKIKFSDFLSEAFGIKPSSFSLPKKETFILTNAGGAGAILTDILSKKGIKTLPVKDILGTASPENYEQELKNLEKKDFKGNIAVILTPQKMSNPKETAHVLAKSKLKKQTTVFFLGNNSIRESLKILKKARIKNISSI